MTWVEKTPGALLSRTIQTLDTSTNQKQRQANVSCLMPCHDNKQLYVMLNTKGWVTRQFRCSNQKERFLLLLFNHHHNHNLSSKVAVFASYQAETL